MSSKIKIYNTARNSVENFVPLDEKEVSIYCCGPTVYNYAHIGNLRTYVFEDILSRTFEKHGYTVRHVMNITDVGHLQSDADEGDDKMSLASQREQKSPWDIAAYYTDAFFKDCHALGIQKPTIVCKATDHITDMIDMITGLIQKGHAYESNGNVYFDVSTFKSYSEFANLQLEAQKATERVDLDSNKRNQIDFALWFSQSKYPNQIMKWDSPWGVGFPGWHIECSAMSSKYLGSRFDIHCGGIDHICVHHTNEIAQSDCFHGHKSVNYWMHGAFLTVDTGKMSKSSGEFLTIEKLVKDGFNPLSYRYLILTAHYRSELKFSYEALESAQNAFNGIVNKVQEWKANHNAELSCEHAEHELVQSYLTEFFSAMREDLHTPSALSILWAVIKESLLSEAQKLYLVLEFDSVLGLGLENITRGELSNEEANLLEKRRVARSNKDWAQSDALRDELLNMGIQVKDSSDGMEWIRI